MLGRIEDDFWIEPTIQFAYGSNIFIGDNFYANVGLKVIDDTKIRLASRHSGSATPFCRPAKTVLEARR